MMKTKPQRQPCDCSTDSSCSCSCEDNYGVSIYSLHELKLLRNHSEDDDDNDSDDDKHVAVASIKEGVCATLTQQYRHNHGLLDAVLERLKVPPIRTTVRLTHAQQRDAAIQEIQAQLQPKHATDKENVRVEAHPVLSDLICISSENPDDAPSEVGRRPRAPLYHCRVPPVLPSRSCPTGSKEKLGAAGATITATTTATADNVACNECWRRKAGWPTHSKVVIVDRVCGEAVLRGAHVFVKGVMSAEANLLKGDAVAIYADLGGHNNCSNHRGDNRFTRGLTLKSYCTTRISAQGCRRRHRRCVLVGVGTAQCDRSYIFSASQGLAVILEQTAGPWQPSMRDIVEEITSRIPMMLQNLPSAMVAHVLLDSFHGKPRQLIDLPQPPLMILDMCAAPGGKASHVAALAATKLGTVVACDKSRRKVLAMRQLFEQLGVAHNTVPLVLNTTQCVLKITSVPTIKNLSPSRTTIHHILSNAKSSQRDGLLQVKGFPPSSFDCILLDPPCSALGLRPKLYIDERAVDMQANVRYQKQFVDAAVQLLKPWGILTYSTCTINSGENEGMVRYILDEYSHCMELLPIVTSTAGPLALLGGSGLPLQGLDPAHCALVRRFDPANTVEDTMGFFIAKFRKICANVEA